MTVTDSKLIKESIHELITITQQIIEKGKHDGTLKPRKNDVYFWKLNDFEYTDNGVKSSGASGEQIIKDDWLGVDFAVSSMIEKTSQYQKLLSSLEPIFKDKTKYVLRDFTLKLCSSFLEENIEDTTLKENLLKQIEGKPLLAKAVVDIVGLTIRNKTVKISDDVTIRQVHREDLEKELSSRHDLMNRHPYPSAIITIETNVTNPINLQNKVNEIITLLRLFKTGSIRYLRYSLSSDSFGSILAGTLTSGEQIGPIETATIHENEVEPLKKFYEYMYPLMKSRLDLQKSNPSFREIVFQRYSESLLKGGTVEQQISSGIMGLEGLLLRDHGELQELSYRLRMRVAKIMSFFGYEPFQVKRLVTEMYNIRSKFVHGSILDYDSKEKMSEKYGEIKKPLRELLNYLRLILLISISMGISKGEFVDIIDKSFLSEEYNKRLSGIINPIKSFTILN